MDNYSSRSESDWMTEYESTDESDTEPKSKTPEEYEGSEASGISRASVGAEGPSRNHSPAPSLCDFCTAITIKALETEPGYAHVPDVRQIGETSLTCELCDFLKLALIARTQECMPVDAKGSIKMVEGALERLSPYLGEKKIDLQERCPVFLTMQSNMLAKPQKLYIRLSHTMGRYVTLISIGYIYLQQFLCPLLLLPRLEEDELVSRFAYMLKESEQQAKIKDPR